MGRFCEGPEIPKMSRIVRKSHKAKIPLQQLLSNHLLQMPSLSEVLPWWLCQWLSQPLFCSTAIGKRQWGLCCTYSSDESVRIHVPGHTEVLKHSPGVAGACLAVGVCVLRSFHVCVLGGRALGGKESCGDERVSETIHGFHHLCPIAGRKGNRKALSLLVQLLALQYSVRERTTAALGVEDSWSYAKVLLSSVQLQSNISRIPRRVMRCSTGPVSTTDCRISVGCTANQDCLSVQTPHTHLEANATVLWGTSHNMLCAKTPSRASVPVVQNCQR